MEKNIMHIVSESLSRQLIVLIVLFSSFLTLLITSFQLYGEYSYGVAHIHTQVEQIKTTSLPAITESLWDLDNKQVQTQLNGFIQQPDILYIEVQSNDEKIASAGKKMQDSDSKTHKMSLIYNRTDQEKHNIGTLIIVTTLEGVYQNLYDRAIVILISNAIKTALVSIFMYILFQSLVIKHILVITTYLLNLSPKSKNPDLQLDNVLKNDELELVVCSINEMKNQLFEASIKLEKYEKGAISKET